MLEDILEKEVDSKYILTPAQIEMIANWGWYEDPIASADKWVEKIGTLTTHCGKMSNGIKLLKWNWGYRKLTPIECERLQTLPDGYTSAASDTQRYIQLGNGWTVSVIAHIFRNLFG
jgi:site-specific DNA-cytosine methylase